MKDAPASTSMLRRLKVRSGTLLILGIAVALILGWFAYRPLIPPRWLHNFVADIAFRATPDPNAPPPYDTRQATPRGLADHPYICFRKLVSFPWDRFLVVPSHEDPRTVPELSGLQWPDHDLDRYAPRMVRDPRYQLLVLVKDHRVVADALFYTFWADLSALARPDGFTPEDAIFTAAVHNGRYVLSPVAPPFPRQCS